MTKSAGNWFSHIYWRNLSWKTSFFVQYIILDFDEILEKFHKLFNSFYADDTTFHACDSNLEDLIRRLKDVSILAVEWFDSNYMKLNQDNMSLFVIWSQAWSNVCKNRTLKTLRNFHWNFHLRNFKKAGRKMKALARVRTHSSLEHRRTLMKAFSVLSKIFKHSNWSLTWKSS